MLPAKRARVLAKERIAELASIPDDELSHSEHHDAWRLRFGEQDGWIGDFNPATDRTRLMPVLPDLPEAVRASVDLETNRVLLRELVRNRIGAACEPVIEHVARRMPTDVLRLIKATGFRSINLVPRSIGENRLVGFGVPLAIAAGATTALGYAIGAPVLTPLIAFGAFACLGKRAVKTAFAAADYTIEHLLSRRPNREAHGATWVAFGLAEVAGSGDATELAEAMVHELFHLVDVAMGWVSLDDELRKQSAADEQARDDGRPSAPSDYALTDRREYLPELACSYLGFMSGCNSNQLAQSTLRRRNPGAVAFFEKLILERIPRALATSSFVPVDAWTT